MNGKLCSKCKTEISLSYNAYCYRCLRIMMGRDPEPKFHRDSSNKLCSKCKTNPRLPYHNYCHECKNKSLNEWIDSRGGHWESLTPEQKEKAVVRKYVNNRVKRGHISRKPCLVCGKEPAEIHHWDYERMTLNVDWFCQEHHVIVERMKKKGLTKDHIMAYLLNQPVG